MFKDPAELKAFILWAKEQKIQRIKVDNIEVELSTLAFIDEPILAPLRQSIMPKSDKLVPEKAAEPTEDPDLFWSSSN